MLDILHQRFSRVEDTAIIYQLLAEINFTNPMPFMQLLNPQKFQLAILLLEYLKSYFIKCAVKPGRLAWI